MGRTTELKIESRPHNTGFASGGLTCKLGALLFYSSSMLIHSFVLQNPPERKAKTVSSNLKVTMQQFKLRPDGFKEVRRQMLITVTPIILIAVTVGIIISLVNSKDKTIGINVLPFLIPLFGVSIGWGLYRSVNRQKRLFDSYTLTFTNNLITREQLNTPTISIYFDEIKGIVKNKNGSFVVRGKNVTDVISIPAQIENYAELLQTLTQLKPLSTKSNGHFLQKYRGILSLLTIGLMLCVYTVTNKIIVTLSGVLLVGLMLWSFLEVHRSKNIDAKTKRSMWWVILVLASVIAVMIMKLTGQQKT